METSQLFDLLKDLEVKAELAFTLPPDVLLLTEIKDELFKVERDQRFHLKAFVDEFINKLFKLGIGLRGESLENYNDLPIKKSKKGQFRSKGNNFEETFKLAIKCLKLELKTLKNYFFITLNSDVLQNYNLLILHDKDYFVNPFKNCLQGQFENITVYTIEDFQKGLIIGEIEYKNYICLLLLKSKMNAPLEIKNCSDNLKKILKFFDSSEHISIKSTNINENFYFKGTLTEKGFLDENFFDEIEYLTSTFLTNTALLYEEEKIIKLLFKNFDCPLLEYKLLKGGNSGAKVIEIRLKQKFNNPQARRFIVKYRPLSESRKLNEEVKNFNNWIGGFEGFSDYICNYQKTFTHEGLLYSYAKSDYEKDSFPFSAILNNSENQFHENAHQIIDELFDIDEFKCWKRNIETKTDKIKEIYKPFIKTDVFQEIQKILNLTDEELENLKLIQNYDKIVNYEITTKLKVCHGDLHTDNFFKDNRNIYLIDFGFTQFLPAVIDHAFLEASIKFNHIPRFIDLDLLKEVERELLDEETFSASHKFTCTNRTDLKYYLDIIKRIRTNSNGFLSTSNKLEYLISLFMVTFKLIKYSDLNQLYALNSASILADKIVRDI